MMSVNFLAAVAHVAVPDAVTFAVAAVVVVLGAIGVVATKSPIHGALCLVGTLIGVAVLFLEEQADFLAAVQVIVYAGAIVVLFLFVMMLMGVDREESFKDDPMKVQRVVGIIVGACVLAGVLILANVQWVTGAHSANAPLTGRVSNVNDLANSVFTVYLLPFEATAALLITAVVGAVLLARRRSVVPLVGMTESPEVPPGSPEVSPTELPGDDGGSVAEVAPGGEDKDQNEVVSQ